MRLGIDCRHCYDVLSNEGAGIERYTYHLAKNLVSRDKANDYVLFFYSDLSPETIHRIKGVNPRVKVVKVVRRGLRIPLWDSHIKFSRILRRARLDLTIFPAGAMPLSYCRPSWLVIHDFSIYRHPEWFPDRQWLATKIVVPRSIKKAKKIIAVSHSTLNDLKALFKKAALKARVIYPGVAVKDGYLEDEAENVKNKFGIGADYILFIGTMEPRKNALNLIKAFSNYIFENEESNVSLALAGIRGWKSQLFFQELNKITQRVSNARIKYIGKISNRERNILIKNCRAFVFPSLYEGFGFPVVEAMALGVPVVASDNSSLKELGDDCAVLVNPEDINSIRQGIKKALEDKVLRRHLILKGKERASQFSWEKTADEFLKFL